MPIMQKLPWQIHKVQTDLVGNLFLVVCIKYYPPPRYSWNIVESGAKHHNLNSNPKYYP